MQIDQQALNTTELSHYYRHKKVCILGAAGFIGRHLARRLTSMGAQLDLIVREPHSAAAIFSAYGIEGNIITLDIQHHPSALLPFYKEFKPNITFNLAGYGVDRSETDPESAYAVNCNLLRTIAKAAAEIKHPDNNGQDIIHTGSALEYGEANGNLSEASNVNPTTLYGQSKLAGTKMLQQCSLEFGLQATTARLFTVYGPGEHTGRLLPTLTLAAQSGETIPLTAGLQQRDFTYVDDVAEGLLRLGITEAQQHQNLQCPGIVNLASGHLTSVREFIEIAANELHIEPQQLQLGAIPVRHEEMQHLPVTNRQLRKLTRWQPELTIAEGVNRNMTFLQNMN